MGLIFITMLALTNPTIQGYGVGDIESPLVNVQLGFSPDTNSLGNSFIGTFNIENKLNPLFRYTIGMWAPCGKDFREVTQWTSSALHEDRILFSGVIERDTKIGYNFIIPFVYESCKYQWNIISPRMSGKKPIPLLRPMENLQILFTLTATPEARLGTYTISFEDQYGFAGRSSFRFDKGI